jgi:hypothetical protein
MNGEALHFYVTQANLANIPFGHLGVEFIIIFWIIILISVILLMFNNNLREINVRIISFFTLFVENTSLFSFYKCLSFLMSKDINKRSFCLLRDCIIS